MKQLAQDAGAEILVVGLDDSIGRGQCHGAFTRPDLPP